MTLDEVSEYLHFHRTTVYRLVRAGDLPAIKFGARYRFEKAAIDRWIAKRTRK